LNSKNIDLASHCAKMFMGHELNYAVK
jgi:hypothetical protein